MLFLSPKRHASVRLKIPLITPKAPYVLFSRFLFSPAQSPAGFFLLRFAHFAQTLEYSPSHGNGLYEHYIAASIFNHFACCCYHHNS